MPGFGGSMYDFEERGLEPLARHRVVAVDLFGSGWSERRDDFRCGWTLWSDQLAATWERERLGRALPRVVAEGEGVEGGS